MNQTHTIVEENKQPNSHKTKRKLIERDINYR